MADPIILTRDKVKREWSDFEPKLVTAILSGAGSAVIIAIVTPIAKKAGIDLSPELAAQIPLGIAAFIGWLTPSVGTTVTKRSDGAQTSETHSGNPVTTITQSTPVQTPGAPVIQQTSPGVFTKVISEPEPESHADPNAPTQVMGPNYLRAGSFLNTLPSSQDDTH